MAGRGREISVRYAVSVVDKGTKHLLAEDRKIRQSVKETAKEMRKSASTAETTGKRQRVSAQRVSRDYDTVGARAKRAASGVDHLNVALGNSTHQTKIFSRIVSLIKFPAMIAGLGAVAQGAAALGAGAAAAVAALAPLSGAIAAYPVILGAAAQAMGVFKLATLGMDKAFEGLTKGLKEPTPAMLKFGKHLEKFAPQLARLRKEAEGPILKGLTRGVDAASKNFKILPGAVRGTARAIGELAERAGKLAGSKGFGRDLQALGRTNIALIRSFGGAGLKLASAFRHVMVAAGPLVLWMGKMAGGWAKNIDGAAKAGRESGRMAKFFESTRKVMTRVGSIAGSLGKAFWNIGKAAAPLGREILGALDKASGGFAKWTSSVKGRNELKKYFADSKPAIFEMGRLIRDVTKAFFSLSRGKEAGQLLKIVRTELLPSFVSLVKATTAAFGPAVIRALANVALLFGQLAGANGPLTLVVKMLGGMARGATVLLQKVPGLKTLVVTLAGLAAVSKAFGFAAAITGVGRLAAGYKTLRTTALGAAAAERVAAAAGGVPVVGALARRGAPAVVQRPGALAPGMTANATKATGAAAGGGFLAGFAGKLKALPAVLGSALKRVPVRLLGKAGPIGLALGTVAEYVTSIFSAKGIGGKLKAFALTFAKNFPIIGPIVRLGLLVVKHFGNSIKPVGKVLLAPFKAGFGLVKSHIQTVVKVWSTVFKVGLAAFKAVVMPVLRFIANAFRTGFRTVAAMVRTYVRTIGRVWDAIVGALRGPARAGVRGVRAVIGTLAGVARGGVRAAVGAIRGAWNIVKVLTSPVRRAVGAVADAIKGIGGPAVRAVGSVLSKIGDAFGKLPGIIKNALGSAGKWIGDIGRAIADWLNDHTPLGDKVGIDIPHGPDIHITLPKLRRGGQAGGLAMVSPGELAVEPGGRSFMIPGRRTGADSVLGLFRRDTAIITGPGQQLLARGATIDETLTHQLPHFASGGRVAQAARKAGLRGSRLLTAVAVAGAESGWNERAHGDRGLGGSFGLWQIHKPAHPQYYRQAGRIFDPDYNAQAMAAISSGGSNWQPWTTFREGTHRGWLGRAAAAVRGMGRAGGREPRSGGTRAPAGKSKLSFGGALPSAASAWAAGYELGGAPLAGGIGEILAGASAKIQTIDPPSGRGGRGSAPRASRGGRSGLPAKVQAAVAEANRIDRAHYPYVWGGGHTQPARATGGGYDCSGAVARVMQRAGFNFPTGVSGSYAGWGSPGKGRHISIFANPQHTFMAIRGKGFGTSSSNPGGGAGWLDYNSRSGFTVRHPKGFRRGGIVGFQGGGITRQPRGTLFAGLPRAMVMQLVEILMRRATHYRPPAARAGSLRATVGTLGRAGMDNKAAQAVLRGFASFVEQLDETSAQIVRAHLARVRAQIRRIRRGGVTRRERPVLRRLREEARADVQRLAAAPSYGRLERMERSLGRRIARLQRGGVTRDERVQIRRLEAAQRIVQTEMGRRTAMIVEGVEKQAQVLERARTRLSQFLRWRGIDEASVEGIRALQGLQKAQLEGLQRMRAQLRTALRRALKAGDRDAVKDISDRLTEIGEEISETVTSLAELWRERIRAAAQRGFDVASHRTTMAQGALSITEARQRLAGTAETPAALRARAAATTRTVIPGMQAVLGALQGQLRAAQQTQAPIADIFALQEQIQAQQLEILNAQVEAVELLRQAAESATQAAQHMVTMAGFATARAQGGVALLEAQQRMAGTQDTAESLRARAALTTSTVIPAMQAAVPTMKGVLAALRDQLKLAVATHAPLADIFGLQEQIESQQLDISQYQLEILNAQVEAKDLLAQAAQAATEATQRVVAMAQGGLTLLEAQQQLRGTAGMAGAALERESLISGQIIPALQAQLRALNDQLKVALELAQQSLVDSTLEAIQSVQTEIVGAMQAAREAIQAAAHAVTESAAHISTMADLGLSHLELEQKLAGTFESGGAERAKFIRESVVPGIERELEALRSEQALAQAQSDQARLRELAELIAGKDNERLTALLAAMELTAANTESTAENTEQTAAALKNFGGTIGFEQRGQNWSDFVGLGTGF
jgi:hypothetical protein